MRIRHLSSVALFVAGAATAVGIMLLMRGPSTQEPSGPAASNASTSPRETAQTAPVPPDRSPSSSARDPGSLLAEAIANGNRDERAASLRRLAADLVGRDVKSALDLGARIPDANDRLEYTRALFAAWAARDPKAALDYARHSFRAGILQAEALTAGIEQWAGADPRGAAGWIDVNLSGPLKEQGSTALMQGWARVDPENAAAWFASTGSTSQSALNALVTTWADLNPRAAAAWVESLSNPDNKLIARVSLASEWAQQAPEQAAEYVKPLLSAPGAGDLTTALINAWGTVDAAAAASWIQQLPTGAARNQAAGILASVWAASDIQAAVRWSEKLEDPDIRAEVIDHLGTTWGAIEPAKALAWIGTLPQDEARKEATLGALNSWAATDPLAMSEWIKQQPSAPLADLARQSLAEVEADRDPVKALDLASQTTDPALRQDLTTKVYRQWVRNDAAAANSWLQSAALPPELKARLNRLR